MMPFDVNKMVMPVYFRQDAVLSQKIFEAMEGGKALFPDDSLAQYAKRIIDSREVTGQTFAQNLYSNQDSIDDNLSILAKHHIEVNWHHMLHFDYDMLKELEKDLKNGLWEQFCAQIYFADEQKGKEMKESLLGLPKNPAYQHYFNIDYYNSITAYDADLHRRANMKKKK